MKINAICVVKNDADIIEETLLNAMKFCHRIYIFDNHCDDGTWEILQSMASRFRQIVIAVRSNEVYCNQFRNRIYNMYHHLYNENDWWYIGDADELLHESPRAMLEKATRANKNRMDVWQANFYFTDEDLRNYQDEDKSLTMSQRRRYYSINWREARFFKNEPTKKWSETISGRIPPWADKSYRDAAVSRRYAERTPEQSKISNALPVQTPYSFLHVKRRHDKSFLKVAKKLHRYNNDGNFVFTLQDKLHFYLKSIRFWLQCRVKKVANVFVCLAGPSKSNATAHLVNKGALK